MTTAALALSPGDRAVVAVQATTVWTAPHLARQGVDDPAVAAPTDLEAWNRNMPQAELRRWLLGKLETQALYGEVALIDEVDGDWARIIVPSQTTSRDPRGYPGWVPLAQLTADSAYEALLATAPTATVTADRAPLLPDSSAALPSPREISFDTVLPVLSAHIDQVEVALPGGGRGLLAGGDVVVRQPGEKPAPPTVEDLIATGERFLGLPYLWAGISAYGYDCSGFVRMMCRHHGIDVARDAGDQMHISGLEPVDRADLRRGDLVFFATAPGAEEIRHVAMHMGEDRIMHAPNSSGRIEVVSLTAYDTAGEYAGARRLPLD